MKKSREREGDWLNKHYSDKGGYQARGDFWRNLSHIAKTLKFSPSRDVSWLMKRDMPRHPRNGKR